MERIGPVHDEEVLELPNLLLWDLRIDPQPPTLASDLVPADAEQVRVAIEVRCDAPGVVETIVAPEFWHGLSNPTNLAEAMLVEAFVRRALRLAGLTRLRLSPSYSGLCRRRVPGSFTPSPRKTSTTICAARSTYVSFASVRSKTGRSALASAGAGSRAPADWCAALGNALRRSTRSRRRRRPPWSMTSLGSIGAA